MMNVDNFIMINGRKYRTVDSNSFQGYKNLKQRIKTIKQKIKAYEKGTVGEHYKNYPILLAYLETLL